MSQWLYGFIAGALSAFAAVAIVYDRPVLGIGLMVASLAANACSEIFKGAR